MAPVYDQENYVAKNKAYSVQYHLMRWSQPATPVQNAMRVTVHANIAQHSA